MGYARSQVLRCLIRYGDAESGFGWVRKAGLSAHTLAGGDGYVNEHVPLAYSGDESLEESANLPYPDAPVVEIVEDLNSALTRNKRMRTKMTERKYRCY